MTAQVIRPDFIATPARRKAVEEILDIHFTDLCTSLEAMGSVLRRDMDIIEKTIGKINDLADRLPPEITDRKLASLGLDAGYAAAILRVSRQVDDAVKATPADQLIRATGGR
jgi:hypothetical protein